jgi:(p)ppGpp synthase/HD superfamily hydrolase
VHGSRHPKLLWNARLDAAVAYAGKIHKLQTRKGSTAPYVAHLLDAAAIALKHGATEDEAIAALLHDTLENGSHPAKIRREIRRRFGGPVLELVEACTAQASDQPKTDWLTRKKAYVKGIAAKTASEKFVSACDKTANLGDMIEDYRRQGDTLWERYDASPVQVLGYYKACARELAKGRVSMKLDDVLDVMRERLKTLARLK